MSASLGTAPGEEQSQKQGQVDRNFGPLPHPVGGKSTNSSEKQWLEASAFQPADSTPSNRDSDVGPQLSLSIGQLG